MNPKLSAALHRSFNHLTVHKLYSGVKLLAVQPKGFNHLTVHKLYNKPILDYNVEKQFQSPNGA